MADKERIDITLPVARVINHSLFVKDAYKDAKGREGTPSYKLEQAFDPDDIGEESDFEEAMIEAAIAQWGKGAENEFFDGEIALPYRDGNQMKKKREKKGKKGDAYEGKIILRANTIFNKDGDDAPGGIAVYDEELEPIDGTRQSEIYNGCYGQMNVTIHCYEGEDNQGNEIKGIKLYLNAFQKHRDGERLASQTDHSKNFKPVGRSKSEGEGGGKRRRRSKE